MIKLIVNGGLDSKIGFVGYGGAVQFFRLVLLFLMIEIVVFTIIF